MGVKAGLARLEGPIITTCRLKPATQLLVLSTLGRADGHHLAHRIHQLPSSPGIRVGPEIAGLGIVLFPGVLDGRKYLSFGQRDKRIALAVLEVRVEVGRMLFDQVVLKHQRFMLVFHHDVFKGVNLAQKQRDLGPFILQVHILAHTLPQTLGLSHVKHRALSVLPQIHPGQRRHVRKLAAKCLHVFAKWQRAADV